MVRQPASTDIFYPETDGKPLADNTKQFRLITTIQGNLDVLVPDFVAGNLLWYPVKGRPDIRISPDVIVVLGRPKGDRGSYRQWEEGNIAPQVVFEIASPSNSRKELEEDKLKFYQTYGVKEYYLYDPDRIELKGWRRQGQTLVAIASMLGWVSPRLGTRFDMVEGDLKMYFPNGEPFTSYVEIKQQQERDRQRAILAETRANLAEERAIASETEKERERQRAILAEERAAQLAARLQALGIDPEAIDPD